MHLPSATKDCRISRANRTCLIVLPMGSDVYTSTSRSRSALSIKGLIGSSVRLDTDRNLQAEEISTYDAKT